MFINNNKILPFMSSLLQNALNKEIASLRCCVFRLSRKSSFLFLGFLGKYSFLWLTVFFM